MTAPVDHLSASHWFLTARETFTAAKLSEDISADVAIVGGGVLGLSAALQLAEGGASVAVLEADCIAAGGSGRNGGLVVPSLPRVSPQKAVAALGEHGARLLKLLIGGGDTVFRLIETHGIACDAVQSGWLNPAHGGSVVPDLKARFAAWRGAGAAVEWLDREATARAVGCDKYYAAIRDPTGGHLNPVSYARGLARATVAAGGKVFEESPVTTVERIGEHWRLTTPQGTVRAGELLQATNGQRPGLSGPDARATLPLIVYQMATEPLPQEARDTVLPGGEALSDTRQHLFAIRWTADGRIGIGGMLPITHARGVHRVTRTAERRLGTMFPVLEGVRIERVWRGRVTLTGDFLPKLFDLGPDRLAAIGCNGRGLVMGTVLGQAIAQTLLDPSVPLPVAPQQPTAITARPIVQRLPELLLPAAFIADRLSERTKEPQP
ncbi:MAG: FAD-binding oxidoreductase [Pseudomonadota bacterium]